MTSTENVDEKSSVYKRSRIEEASDAGGEATALRSGRGEATALRSGHGRGSEPVETTLRAVGQTIGISFPKLGSRPLPMSLMLEVSKWFTTPELVALRKTESKIELETVQLPVVKLDQRHARGYRTQPFDWIRHVDLWRPRVVELQVGDDFAPLFPNLIRAFPRPFFPTLRVLKTDSKQRIQLTPLTWRQILSHCPELERLTLIVEPSPTEPMTEESWLAPLRDRERAWIQFHIGGVSAPPSVYLAVATPELRHLSSSSSFPGQALPVWTVQQLQELIRKTTSDEGKIAPMQWLHFGSNLRAQDGDMIADLLLSAYPNLTQFPWSYGIPMQLSSATLQRMYATWPCMIFAPPLFAYHNSTPDVKTIIDKTRSPLWSLVTNGTHQLFNHWDLADFEKLIASSSTTACQRVALERLNMVPDRRPTFDSKALFHAVDHRVALEIIKISFPCVLEEQHLQGMLSCPRLYSITLGPPTNVPLRHTSGKDIQMQTLQRLLEKVIRSRPAGSGKRAIVALCSSILVHFEASQWAFFTTLWWKQTLGRPDTVGFSIALPSSFEAEIRKQIKNLDETNLLDDLYAAKRVDNVYYFGLAHKPTA